MIYMCEHKLSKHEDPTKTGIIIALRSRQSKVSMLQNIHNLYVTNKHKYTGVNDGKRIPNFSTWLCWYLMCIK